MNKGFTLIELLVIISILGMLSAIIIPNVLKFLDSGKMEAANTEYQAVLVAVTAYMVENGEVPSGTDDLDYLGVLTGTYSIDEAGNVTGTGGWDGLTWDDKWVIE